MSSFPLKIGGVMKELRVIIAGGRDFNDFPLLMNKCIAILVEETKENDAIEKIRIVSGVQEELINWVNNMHR